MKTDDFEISIHDDNSCTIVSYTGNDKDLIIPDTIAGYKVVKISGLDSGEAPYPIGTFSGSACTTIVIPDSVTHIDRFAFVDLLFS